MEMLKSMKETLMAQAQGQMGNLAAVDAKELGEVVDMIKDLAEAEYYCSITKAMEEKEKEPKIHYYYDPMIHDTHYGRDMDKYSGRMYYTEPFEDWGDGRSWIRSYTPGMSNSNSGSERGMSGGRNYSEREYPMTFRDSREGRSPMSRRMYMESKEMHKDKNTQMMELEKYMQELSKDITEMIQDASPEEKQLLQKKISTLATKIE